MNRGEPRRQRGREEWVVTVASRPMIRGKGSAAKKRELIREALLEDVLQDAREIEEDVGCDHKTVGKVRREMEVAGEIPLTYYDRTIGYRIAFGPDEREELLATWLRDEDVELLAQRLVRVIEHWEEAHGTLSTEGIEDVLLRLRAACPRPAWPLEGDILAGESPP